MNKKGFEFSFGWIFSIIVGVVVIFLAIYASTNLVKSERNVQDTLNARELEILFQPVETVSSEAGVRQKSIIFPDEARLTISCSDSGEFGNSKIEVATRRKASEEWRETGVGSTLNNKFIFSDDELEGKEFHIFTKPFTMPFKVGDLIFVWDKDYCFINPSQDIVDDFDSLNLEESGIEIKEKISECKPESVKVCFGFGTDFENSCDVNVDLTTNRVQKEGRNVYYRGNLMYGAIFSDNDNYDCLVKRIMLKSDKLAELYSDKSTLISIKSENSCSSGISSLLEVYRDKAKVNSNQSMLDTYIQFNDLYNYADEIDDFNSGLSCELWKEDFVK